MNKLIEALQIFAQYQNLDFPTICEHDVLYVVGITRNEVTQEHRLRLNELGFQWDEDCESWASSRFGSA